MTIRAATAPALLLDRQGAAGHKEGRAVIVSPGGGGGLGKSSASSTIHLGVKKHCISLCFRRSSLSQRPVTSWAEAVDDAKATQRCTPPVVLPDHHPLPQQVWCTNARQHEYKCACIWTRAYTCTCTLSHTLTTTHTTPFTLLSSSCTRAHRHSAASKNKRTLHRAEAHRNQRMAGRACRCMGHRSTVSRPLRLVNTRHRLTPNRAVVCHNYRRASRAFR